MKKYLLLISLFGITEFAFSQNDFFSGTWSSKEDSTYNIIGLDDIEWVFKGDSVSIMSVDEFSNATFSKGTFSIARDTLSFYIIEEIRITSNYYSVKHWKCSPYISRMIFKNESNSFLLLQNLEDFKYFSKIPQTVYSALMKKGNESSTVKWNFVDLIDSDSFFKMDY